MKNVSALRDKNWIPSFSSLPLAGETTEGEAGCEDFFSSLLERGEAALKDAVVEEGNGRTTPYPIEEEQSEWDELIDRHLVRQAVERGLSRNSREAYGRDLDDFQQFCRAHRLAPHELDPRVVTAYLENLAQREFAVATQRRRLAAVRGLIRELLDRGLLESDPSRYLKLRPH